MDETSGTRVRLTRSEDCTEEDDGREFWVPGGGVPPEG